jgi:hypothetical protein
MGSAVQALLRARNKDKDDNNVAYSFRIVALTPRPFETFTEDAHIRSVSDHQIVA